MITGVFMRHIIFTALGLSFTINAMAASIVGDASPVAAKQYQVGQLVKCSYKGRFESTKTVECQLRQGLHSDKIWLFSAAENQWSQLEAAAGQQVIIGYRKGGIKHMEADYGLLSLAVIGTAGERKTLCETTAPNDSYSVGFRVARIAEAEDLGQRWQAKGQLGGEGNADLWTFEVGQQQNPTCYQQFIPLMTRGETHIFYYRQAGKNDEYQVWRID
jgi:hypothetical protein